MKPIFLHYCCRACGQDWTEVDESKSATVEIAIRAATNAMRPHFCPTEQSRVDAATYTVMCGTSWGFAQLISARDYA